MCMAEGADPASVYREKIVTARKQHRCDECGRPIECGERYQYVFAIWEGSPGAYHTCQHCLVAQDWLRAECGGWLFEGVEEDISEHVMGAGAVFDAVRGYGSGPARLVVGIRRKWRRFDGAGLMPIPSAPAISGHVAP
jgi:hypothetical protein